MHAERMQGFSLKIPPLLKLFILIFPLIRNFLEVTVSLPSSIKQSKSQKLTSLGTSLSQRKITLDFKMARGFSNTTKEQEDTSGNHTTTTTTTISTNSIPTIVEKPTTTPRRDPTKGNLLQPPKPIKKIPQAARLPFFYDQWTKVTSNHWILRVIKEGYKLQFFPSPPPPRPSFKTSYSKNSSSIIRRLIIDYLNKGAIRVIEVKDDQYVSRIFEVPKKTGDYRLILDLSDLNLFLKKVHFKMEGLLSISSIISPGDFMASLDLQDAFLTIAMHPSMFKYLCFDFEGVRYCFLAMVFGLSCAPRIFTKLLKVPLSFLRIQGFKNSAWLDDILLVDSSYLLSSESISQCRSLLESLGFIIKPSKSNLIPSQSITHVGFLWDSASFSVKVLPEKVSSLQSLCSSALSGPVSIRFLAKIIGVIDSFKFGCPIAPLHYRSLQFDLIHNYPLSEDWDAPISLSPQALDDLKWWLECDSSLPPYSLASFSPTHQLETDASLKGWGAYSHSDLFTQGKWTPNESHYHINSLELLAVLFGIQSLFPGSNHISLVVLCDNIPAVRYINRKGGTRSKDLCKLSLALWDYCIDHNILLRAVYFRGSDNTRADDLSRNFQDNHDYHLSATWFHKLHSLLDSCL